MWLRVKSDGTPTGTQLLTDTGELIAGVLSIKIVLNPGEPTKAVVEFHLPKASIEIGGVLKPESAPVRSFAELSEAQRAALTMGSVYEHTAKEHGIPRVEYMQAPDYEHLNDCSGRPGYKGLCDCDPKSPWFQERHKAKPRVKMCAHCEGKGYLSVPFTLAEGYRFGHHDEYIPGHRAYTVICKECKGVGYKGHWAQEGSK